MRRRALLGASLLYAALAVVSQRALLPGLGDHVYFQGVPGNDCLLHAWTLAWDQHALVTRPCRLLDANIFYPHARTLLYSDHLLGLALPLAPLRLLTANPLLVHNLATIAAPALDALALFALARALTGSAAGALVAGVLYGFAPFRVDADRCQVQMLVAWWPPLCLLLAWRALAGNRVRPALLAGASLALQGLTGIYLSAFFLPFLALAHLWWLGRFPPRRHARGWTALLLAEAAAALAVLPFLLAYHDLQRELGASRSIALNALISLDPGVLPREVPLVSLAALGLAGVVLRHDLPARYRAALGPLLVLTFGSLALAFGPAVPLPFGLGQVRGPYAALFLLPGYDALRAPARFLHLAILGAAPIAAGGVAAVAARLGARRAVPVVALLLAAAIAECWAPSSETIAVPPPARDPVYAWIRTQPSTFRYVELPLDSWVGQSRYQYATTAHWHDTAIGNMGILPPLYPYLVHELQRFPEPDVLALLRALGIDHVVAHTRYLPPAMRQRLVALRGEPASPLALRHEASGDEVLRLPPVEAPEAVALRGRPLDRRGWRATASQADALAARAIDDDSETAWTSYGDLEAALERWYDPVPFLDRWQRFLASLPVRFELDLGAEATVTAVALRLGGSDPLVAADLTLEASADGRTWTAIAARLRPFPDVRAFIAQPAAARFAFIADFPLRARFLRLSSGGAEWRIGNVDVYAE